MNNFEEIKDTLEILEEDLDKYEFIMSLSEYLPQFDQTKCIAEHRVYGCQSKVWCYKDEISKRFTFFTESKLVGGLLHILLVRFQDQTTFNENEFEEFMNELPFGNKITMQRQTGLQSAFKRISHLSSGT